MLAEASVFRPVSLAHLFGPIGVAITVGSRFGAMEIGTSPGHANRPAIDSMKVGSSRALPKPKKRNHDTRSMLSVPQNTAGFPHGLASGFPRGCCLCRQRDLALRHKRKPLEEGELRVRFRAIDSRSRTRVALPIVVTSSTGEVLLDAKTRDEGFDSNDHLEAIVKKGETLRVLLDGKPTTK